MSEPSFFLCGEDCALRPFREADLELWASWFNNQDTVQFMEQGFFPCTAEEQKKRLETMYDSRENLQLAIVTKDGERLVGTVGLHGIDWIHRTADISVILGDASVRGKGIGREAVKLLIEHGFKKLGLHKLTAGMVASNEKSYQLFRSLGFKDEARFREQLFIQGRHQDLIKLGLLASEFLN